MHILIVGAGVLGCAMAHALLAAGHDVTLLARGEWKQHIDEKGLEINHYLQRKTTQDRMRTIEKLAKEDFYDVIFVVMQCASLPQVISDLAENQSQRIVFIGNNGDALGTEREVRAQAEQEKEIAFGFQSTGGRRENGKVISIYKSLSITLGGSDHALSEDFKNHLTALFQTTAYRLTWENQMDAWLKCHLAFILPICYLCYSVDGVLPRANKNQRKLVIDAAYEGYLVLKALNIPIRPEGEEQYFYKGWKRWIMVFLFYVMCKTPLGRLAASDHAMHAVLEMQGLDAQFACLCQQANLAMPHWETLKAQMKSWHELMGDLK